MGMKPLDPGQESAITVATAGDLILAAKERGVTP